MQVSWLSIVPPLIVLVTSFITRRLHLSLIVGILSAALIATTGVPGDAAVLVGKRIWQQISDMDTIYMYSFLVTIGSLIMLICTTGGIDAFGKAIQKKITTKRSIETSSFFLSILVGIDDYLNSLTVGHVMQPLLARFGVAQTKLAYLIHSLAGPLVILVPISSWVAMITSNLDLSGVSLEQTTATKILADPFYVYLKTIPFIFYSVFTIFSVWYIIRRQLSFGPMYADEQKAAQQTTETTDVENKTNNNNSLLDIIFPLMMLVGTVILGILYTGGYHLFGGNNSLLEAFKNNTQNSFVLFSACLFTFIITFILALFRKKMSVNELPTIIKNGFMLMISSILMLTFASTLGLILRFDLHTGTYLAQTLSGALSVTILPLMFFILAAITALLTGSSWGTIALLLPIGIPMLTSMLSVPIPTTLAGIPLLLPMLGAIFSGAVSGDHLSPISETTIMASTSSGSKPLDHAYTQFFYAIPALIASAVSFLIAGVLTNGRPWLTIFVSIAAGLLICISLLHLFNKKLK